MNASLPCIVLLSCVVTGFCSTGGFIGSSQPVIAAPGLDVVLPCRLDPPIDLQRFAVEWLKLGPKTSASGDTVYLYRDGKEEAREKIRPYVGRTQMFTDQLEHGNMSLKILNVTSADAGRYRCKCFTQGKVEDADVQLVVNPDLKTWSTETSQPPINIQTDHEVTEVDQTRHIYWILLVVCCFSFVLTVVFIGFLIKRQRQKRPQNQRHDVECDVVPIKESADLEPPLKEHC